MRVETTDDRIVIGTALAARVEQVWAALTAPDAVSRWWGDHVRLDPRVGGELRERWTDASGRTVTTSGIVTRCDPPAILEMTWADDDWPGSTTVLFSLAEDDVDRSVLTLEHRGWDALPADRRRRLIDEHAAGWRRHMQALSAYLRS